MATRIGKDELTRLKRAREAADRAYNDALTLVDRALAPRPDLPDPPRAFDQRQLTPVNEAWRVAPDVEHLLGTGWKRRLRAWVWDLVGPIVERQQHFNGVLVDHLNRAAPAQVDGQQALSAVVAALAEHSGALETFQSRLIQYLQQITPFVDTKDHEVAGVSRAMMSAIDGLGDEVRRRAEAAAAREQRFAGHVDEMRTTVGQVQHGLLALRRRLEGLAPGEGSAGRRRAGRGSAGGGRRNEGRPGRRGRRLRLRRLRETCTAVRGTRSAAVCSSTCRCSTARPTSSTSAAGGGSFWICCASGTSRRAASTSTPRWSRSAARAAWTRAPPTP